MKTSALVALLLVALFGSQSVFAQKIKDAGTAPVRVYVFAKPVTGFVDEARPIEDSVKDLRDTIGDLDKDGSVKKRSSFQFPNLFIVDTEDESDITLEVVSSGKAQAAPETETTGTIRRGIFGGIVTDSTTTTRQKILPKISTVLHVRDSDYWKEFSIQEQMFWKDLAHNIMRQLDKWVKANRTQLARKEEQN
jgi:hypothetical protein